MCGMDFHQFTGTRSDPAPQDAAARKHKGERRLRALDHCQLKVGAERRILDRFPHTFTWAAS